jgi:hypothetical protein
MCKDLERGFEAVKKKFAGVLAYFGEDGGMSSTDFFTTLHKFVLVSIRRFCGWLLRRPWQAMNRHVCCCESLWFEVCWSASCVKNLQAAAHKLWTASRADILF